MDLKRRLLILILIVSAAQIFSQVTDEFSYANSKIETDQMFEIFSDYADRYLEILQQERTYPLLEVAWRHLINEQNPKKRKVLLADFNKRFGIEIKNAIRQSGITSSAAMSVCAGSTEYEYNTLYNRVVPTPLNSTCKTIGSEVILQMEFERENGPAEVNGCARFDGGYSAVKQFATARVEKRHPDFQVPAIRARNRLMARVKVFSMAGLGPLNVMAVLLRY
ncbi:MAG: hypothetical protein IPO65_00170 [Saprospiraceae bacterium]|nr:hypothetical protein [Saprospiraceae bacterium]